MRETETFNSDKNALLLRRKAELMLVGATFFWGWTFPVVKDAIATMPVFWFLAVRFALAAAFMLPLAGRPRRGVWRLGGGLGVLLFLSFAFQTWGLLYTSSANCAFITGLNIVWLAFFSARDRRAWTAVALAVLSLFLLTGPQQTFNIGDGLTLVCSVFIALHIIVLSRLKLDVNSGELAALQFAVVAVLSLVLALIFEPPLTTLLWNAEVVFALALTVFGATIFSFWAQTHYQRHTTPIRAGLIFVLEPVFAALFALMLYDEELPPEGWAGACLMLVAMLITIRRPNPSTVAR